MLRGRTAGIALLAVIVGAVAAPAANAGAGKQRVEQRVRSAAPDAKRVKESYVSLHAPLPETVGPHPAACDRLGYLRFRHKDGPRKPKRADAVLVAIPGFLGGAASFDQVARNTVRRAAKRDRYVEFWALDRRANCVEDHTGVEAAARAGDPAVAFGYYWGGAEVDGRRFGGFATAAEANYLKRFGLERTLRDWYTVIKRELPGRKLRARKLLCGGHSLGGPLTNLFASWDFDGDPGTTADAGHAQCAGFFGLDTSLTFNDSAFALPGLGTVSELVAETGALPFIDIRALSPETFQVPPVFGVGAFHQPQATNSLELLPHTLNVELAQRLLFSRDAVSFAIGPTIRDFTLTNELTFAGVFDDNSNPIGILRASLGFATGGPIADKSFPAPDPTLAIPEDPDNPLYSWQNYDEVGAGGAPLELNDAGVPYTSRDSEVTDVRQFARAMFEAPADFIEQYFPTRLFVDVTLAEVGDASGPFANRLYDGVGERPALLIQAGDSESNSGDGDGFAAGEPPNDNPLSREVILPGYNHLDVVGAAWRQNGGAPERSSRALARFALEVVGERRRRR